MKRVLSIALAILLMMTAFPIGASAVCEDRIITYYDDGSYMVEEIWISSIRASGTVSGNKATTYYDNNNTALWKATLSGTFTYNGSSATCTVSSCTVSIYNSAWYTISKSASKSGNAAYGTGTVGEKLLGVTVQRVPFSLTLSCDKNGNLS